MKIKHSSLYHMNRMMGGKYHTIISTDAQKAFHKIQHHVTVKTVSKFQLCNEVLSTIVIMFDP